MKKSALPYIASLIAVALVFSASRTVVAQDGIYDDIYQAPTYDTDTSPSNPLDGYSTYDQDDYYQPQNNNQQGAPSSQQYVDENGDTYITNNYYGDYYEDDYDYFYASRINRFHRPIWGFGYYDPFYTNMYWYNYDPFFFGTSIYAGWGWGGFYRPWGWGWNTGFGWGGWYNNWGWNGWGYSPYCYSGWGMGGYGMGYNMGYNHGYWNGYYDGLAMGGMGYYNTYDVNSGIYYGHRAGSGSNGGSGIRSNSLGDRYNRAAQQGLVSHANRDNILQTADARPVVGRTNLDGFNTTVPSRKPSDNARPVQTTPSRTPAQDGTTPSRVPTTAPGRDAINQQGGNGKVPQPADRNPQVQPQRNPQSLPQRTPQAAPQRNPQSVPQRTQPQSIDRSRPTYQAPARVPQRPQRDVYQRGSRPNTTSPAYRAPQQSRPSDVPSRNYAVPQQPQRSPSPNVAPTRPQRSQPAPSRTAPQRTAPSRDYSPQRSAPSPSPSRGISPSPSRGGSFSSPRGGGSSPSRGSGSMGGRRGG